MEFLKWVTWRQEEYQYWPDFYNGRLWWFFFLNIIQQFWHFYWSCSMDGSKTTSHFTVQSICVYLWGGRASPEEVQEWLRPRACWSDPILHPQEMSIKLSCPCIYHQLLSLVIFFPTCVADSLSSSSLTHQQLSQSLITRPTSGLLLLHPVLAMFSLLYLKIKH